MFSFLHLHPLHDNTTEQALTAVIRRLVASMVRTLRTLSGCLTCRARRKKCDESKPQCNTCDRLQLRCRWASVQTTEVVPGGDSNGVSNKHKESNEGDLSMSICTSVSKENRPAPDFSVNANSLNYHATMAMPPLAWSHVFSAAARVELQHELADQCPKLLCLILSPLATSYCSKSLERELGHCTFGYAALSTFSASVRALQSRGIKSHELGYRIEALSKLRAIISVGELLQSERALWTCIISTTLLCLSDVSPIKPESNQWIKCGIETLLTRN